MPKTEAELYQEFKDVIASLRQLNDDLVKAKNQRRFHWINQQITYLEITVGQNPSAAKAVLYTAYVMWYLLRDDAGRGARQRGVHIRLDGRKLNHEIATREELKAAIDDYCLDHPGGKITYARKHVAESFGYAHPDYEGAKTVAKKTGRYNPYKKS